MQLFGLNNYRASFLATLCVALSCVLLASPAVADLAVILTPSKDATLYSFNKNTYDNDPENTDLKANGASLLNVGDTNKNNGVQRGLIQFDFSGIPSGAEVTGVSLAMTVADVPYRVLQRDINFWLVAMQELTQPWSEGDASGGAADEHDTTWFHTHYDPTLHGILATGELNDFAPNGLGYWPEQGYLGHNDLLETATGADVGGTYDDAHALVLKNEEGDRVSIGDTVNWSNNARLISDVQSWVAGTKDNFGWIMVGEEWITKNEEVTRPDNGQTDRASSKIGFYSKESNDPPNGIFPPTLTVTYTAVPEPGTLVLMLLGLTTILLRRVR